MRGGRLDSIVPARLPLDIAAQQVVAEVAAQEWTTDDLFDLVRRASHYTGLDRAAFDEVVELVSDGIETGRGRRGAYLHHDAVNGELRGRRGARLAAATSGGAIPETGDYRVVAEPDDMFVGTVNEDWAVESMAGDIFLLGTHSWQIRKVEPGVVRVRDAGDTPPTVPFWLGEAPARTAELSQEVSDLRARIDAFLAAGDPDGARRWLAEAAGVEGDAATMIVDYLAVGRAALGAMPTADCLVIERFFDDTGGMQLVVHSPHGGRVNRGLGLALRKKFCRSFNFELQAAASDDAVVLSLGLTHSFPLDEVARYVTSATLRDTLEHAVLDSPMFQARWRWNLNRALMVLRFRGGKKNPPPIQRMESDDLLTAVFPMAAACQDNITGPIEIPDHLLVRQTLDDTLHEALDVDGLRELIEGIETGAVRVHCVDTTEASVLSHEIITARPYAFLDDEETQNRRTNAVYLRRGLQVDLGAIGALDPDAVELVHAEVAPVPETADDLHDLLSTFLVVRPRPDWQALFDELAARDRVVVLDHEGTALWTTAEAHDQATGALAGTDDDAVVTRLRGPPRGHRHHHGRPPGRRPPGCRRARWPGAWPRCSSRAWPCRAGTSRRPPCPRRRAARLTTARRPTTTCSGWPAGCWPACTPTPAGRGAAGSSPPPRRTSCASCCAGSTSRPAPSWPAPPAWPRSSSSCRATRPPPVAWEPEVLARRLRHYDPAWLDRLCHDGEVAWLRLTPRAGAATDTSGATPAAPSKATPISVVTRPDLGWLLAAARTGVPAPAVPDAGATTELVEAMAARGACFANDLRRRHPPPPHRRRARPVGRRRPGPGHVRRVRGHPRPGQRRHRPPRRPRSATGPSRPTATRPSAACRPTPRRAAAAATRGRPGAPPAVDPAEPGRRNGRSGCRPAQPGRPAGARRRVRRGHGRHP